MSDSQVVDYRTNWLSDYGHCWLRLGVWYSWSVRCITKCNPLSGLQGWASTEKFLVNFELEKLVMTTNLVFLTFDTFLTHTEVSLCRQFPHSTSGECICHLWLPHKKIDALDSWCLRRILNVYWSEFVTNDEIRSRTGQPLSGSHRRAQDRSTWRKLVTTATSSASSWRRRQFVTKHS